MQDMINAIKEREEFPGTERQMFLRGVRSALRPAQRRGGVPINPLILPSTLYDGRWPPQSLQSLAQDMYFIYCYC